MIDMSSEMEKMNVAKELATARATGKLGREQYVIYWNELLGKIEELKATSTPEDCKWIRKYVSDMAFMVLHNADKIKETE